MGRWGSYYHIPKAIFYLLKGDCNLNFLHEGVGGLLRAVRSRVCKFTDRIHKRPRGSIYTTIRELGPKMPYYRRNYGSQLPNGCICGPPGRERELTSTGTTWKDKRLRDPRFSVVLWDSLSIYNGLCRISLVNPWTLHQKPLNLSLGFSVQGFRAWLTGC